MQLTFTSIAERSVSLAGLNVFHAIDLAEKCFMLKLSGRKSDMTSRDFVTHLAKIMGVERTELATVDRALAKAGLRQVARGRFRPDITLLEGLQIALAWAGVQNLTMADQEVERLRKFHVQEGDYLESVGIEEPPEQPEFLELYGCSRTKLAGRNFFDVVATATQSIGQGKYPAREYFAHIQKGGAVELTHQSGPMQTRRLRFADLGRKLEIGKPRKAPPVTVTVAISGNVLKWIYDATEAA